MTRNVSIGRRLDPALRGKYEALKRAIAGRGRVLIAYSGGVDSTLLLKAAIDALGAGAVRAVIATSDTYPEREVRTARALAGRLGVAPLVIKTRELENPAFAANPPERCYHCKRELFGALAGIARDEGFAAVLDGANADDRSDFRPGARAGRELGVASPLQETGLTKADIRALSKALGLPTWNKPSLACLASRFPYHTPIDAENLRRVGAAEDVLRRLGFGQLRVRHHGAIARIEVEPSGFPRLMKPEVLRRATRALHKLGYAYVTLDLDGYRTGSLNETLSPREAAPARTGTRRGRPASKGR